ncbi:MAG: hypothetical protein GX856_06555 [Gammaproteobacteria bacterium]|jgi:hypothetical protein|nr:hypothetical protein [Gammaproteobacteria bacterium]
MTAPRIRRLLDIGDRRGAVRHFNYCQASITAREPTAIQRALANAGWKPAHVAAVDAIKELYGDKGSEVKS